MAQIAQEHTLQQVLQQVTVKNYLQKIDVVGNTTYIGYAEIGSSDADYVWRIKRAVETGPDAVIDWARGTDEFTNSWDLRTTYTYS